MPPRVLVVDDEPNILATLAPLLRARGYEVLTAMSGRAALETVEREKPDLIVLDLGLPDIDGVDVCRTIRQTLNIPIVVLSARGGKGDKVRALIPLEPHNDETRVAVTSHESLRPDRRRASTPTTPSASPSETVRS